MSPLAPTSVCEQQHNAATVNPLTAIDNTNEDARFGALKPSVNGRRTRLRKTGKLNRVHLLEGMEGYAMQVLQSPFSG